MGFNIIKFITLNIFEDNIMRTKISIFAVIIFMLLFANIAEAQKKKAKSNNLRRDLNGQLLKAPNNNAIYWIDEGKRRHIKSPAVLNSIFVTKNVTNYPDINLVPNGEPITSKNMLVRCKSNYSKLSGYVYLMDKGKKRHITSGSVFNKNSFNWSCIKEQDCTIISTIPTGTPIK